MQDVTKPDLTGAEWNGMTVAERIARCHAFAREAYVLTEAAHPDMKPKYRAIAAQWNMLAAEMETAQRGRAG
jgi:hypothetical protein